MGICLFFSNANHLNPEINWFHEMLQKWTIKVLCISFNLSAQSQSSSCIHAVKDLQIALICCVKQWEKGSFLNHCFKIFHSLNIRIFFWTFVSRQLTRIFIFADIQEKFTAPHQRGGSTGNLNVCCPWFLFCEFRHVGGVKSLLSFCACASLSTFLTFATSSFIFNASSDFCR